MSVASEGATRAYAARARACALEIGERLLEEHGALESGGSGYTWVTGRGLASSPGLALAFMALWEATGDARYEAAMHERLRRASQHEDRPSLGLFEGMSGLRAVAELATRFEPGYRRLVEQCDAYVDGLVPDRPVHPETFASFDLIGGWAGARLARCVRGPGEPDRLVRALGWLIEHESRWCCPHPRRRDEPPENDIGMAHGIAGVLASLALTLSDLGALREPLSRAAWRLAGWGVRCAEWPPAIQESGEGPFRAAWCYGAPGVCAALVEVARALGDRALESEALGALARVAARPSSAWLIEGQSLCHGSAGNAIVFASIPGGGFDGVVAALVDQLLDDFARAGGHCVYVDPEGERSDFVDELNGTAGVALALLTLSGACSGEWTRLHGLRSVRRRAGERT